MWLRWTKTVYNLSTIELAGCKTINLGAVCLLLPLSYALYQFEIVKDIAFKCPHHGYAHATARPCLHALLYHTQNPVRRVCAYIQRSYKCRRNRPAPGQQGSLHQGNACVCADGSPSKHVIKGQQTRTFKRRSKCVQRAHARPPTRTLQISVPAMHAQTLLTQAAARVVWATGYTPRVALALYQHPRAQTACMKDKAGATQQQQKHAVAP